MSDFLNDLVARVLRLEPMVRPVTPALFDPGPAGQTWTEVDEVVEAGPRAVTERDAPPAALPPRASRAEATPPAAEHLGIHETVERHELTIAAPPPAQAIPTANARQPGVVRERVERTEVVLHEEERRIVEEPRVEQRLIAAEPERRREDRAAAASMHHPAARALVRERPQRPAIPRTVTPREAEAQRQETAPAVQVSIGRVEVRAVFPPAPAKPTAPRPSPVVKLEDYLNGNGRR